jgi:myo-inositol-1(or 4)-monophosphatase
MEFLYDASMRVAVDCARAAGQVLREMLHSAAVREKAPKDLVTDADIAAQSVIEAKIHSAFPNHLFLGEESDGGLAKLELEEETFCWVVDPLDGTANFVHGLPNFAVSIALLQGDVIQLGVVYDPMADELYAAGAGRGASLNGKSIRATSCRALDVAMVAASFPPQVTRHSIEVMQFLEILERSQSVRRLGSAALNLCYVGHGRLDAYWAKSLKPWDVLGGAIVAQEAGAMLCRHDGGAFDPWSGELIAAATSDLQREMVDCFRSIGVVPRV